MRSRIAANPIAGAIMRARPGEQGKSVRLASGIDFQRVFTGYASFPDGQLPLGGLLVSERALAQEDKRRKLDQLARAYDQAVGLLMADPDRHAAAIAASFEHHFQSVGAGAPPARLLTRSVEAGDLIYRTDVPLDAVRGDLAVWLRELLGREVDAAFLG